MTAFKSAGPRQGPTAKKTTEANQQSQYSKIWTLNAKTLHAIRCNGETPEVWIFHGFYETWGYAWHAAEHFQPVEPPFRRAALYLPTGDNPANYVWPVHDCEVLCHLAQIDAQEERALAQQLLNAGATVVRSIIHGEEPVMTIFYAEAFAHVA